MLSSAARISSTSQMLRSWVVFLGASTGTGLLMLNNIQDICNGKMTKAEAFGFSDIAVDHVCRFV